jgi:hypothetical protein
MFVEDLAVGIGDADVRLLDAILTTIAVAVDIFNGCEESNSSKPRVYKAKDEVTNTGCCVQSMEKRLPGSAKY